MAYIQIKDASYAYPGGFLAVDDINIEIEKGENVAIVGQNGAGKTTTVKMLNALQRPTKGEVLIGEMNTKDHTTAQVSRVVGYVFQNPDDQIFHATVIGEVEFHLAVVVDAFLDGPIARDLALYLQKSLGVTHRYALTVMSSRSRMS